jgi:hypothetical protein
MDAKRDGAPEAGSTARPGDGGRERRGQPQVATVKLYSLTLPGLDVRADWRVVHDRLLDDFPAIDDVLPTTMVATVMIAYRGPAEIDGWLGSINEAVLSRRLRSARRHAPRAKAVLHS